MTYHPEFWVAAAAAAPVIALAAIISISDAVRLDITIRERSWPITVSRYLALINVATQAFVLSNSLQSLAQEHDRGRSLAFITYCTVLGLVCLVLNVMLLSQARASIARSAHELGQRKSVGKLNQPGSTHPQGPDTNEDAETEDTETEEESP